MASFRSSRTPPRWLLLPLVASACFVRPDAPDGGDEPDDTVVDSLVDDTDPPKPALPPEEALRARVEELAIPPLPPVPAQDPKVVALGRALFADPLLDDNQTRSCAGCHSSWGPSGRAASLARDGLGYVDGRQVPNFSDMGRFDVPLFWGGCVHRLDGAVVADGQTDLPKTDDPLVLAVLWEVGGQRQPQRDPFVFQPTPTSVAVEAVFRRVRANTDYRRLIAAAWPDAEGGTTVRLGEAIAAYLRERTATRSTPWDRWLAGEAEAMSESAKKGALVFFGEGGCNACHTAPAFSDGLSHSIAAPQIGPGTPPYAPEDYGRGRRPGHEHAKYAFVTPRLRNVLLTPPYTHAGALLTLEATIDHHLDPLGSLAAFDDDTIRPLHTEAVLGELNPVWLPIEAPYSGQAAVDKLGPSLDPLLRTPRTLSPEQKRQLVDFLAALTDPGWLQRSMDFPDAVPSGLQVGSFTR